MITLEIGNVISQIHNLNNINIQQMIYQKLSYQVTGFGNNPREFLYNINNGRTYTGLLPHAIQIFNQFNIPYTVNDRRVKPLANANYIIDNKFTARDYQSEIIDRASSREIIQAATGAGKTFIMASLTAKFDTPDVLIIAPKVSLASQIKNEFQTFLNRPIGIVGGGYHDVRDITVSTPQSADAKLVENAKVLLFDECFSYNNRVLMADGNYKPIGQLVEEKSNELVMSFNHQTGETEAKPIISQSKTKLGNKKLMRIKVKKADGTVEIIECTDNHPIWIEQKQEYVMAKDLVKGQNVKVANK